LVNNFKTSSCAKPNKLTEFDLKSALDDDKNSPKSLKLNPSIALYCSLPITGNAVGPIFSSLFKVIVV